MEEKEFLNEMRQVEEMMNKGDYSEALRRLDNIRSILLNKAPYEYTGHHLVDPVPADLQWQIAILWDKEKEIRRALEEV